MPSNWKIRDYYFGLEKNIALTPLLIEVRDEFVASVLRRQIKEYLPRLRIFFAHEVTVGLLEDELLGLNLFSQKKHCFILNAHDLSKGVIDFLFNTEIDWLQVPSTFLSTKANPLLNKFFAREGHHHYLEWPKFWEMGELLELFVSHYGLSLDGEAKRFLVDSLEQTSRHYFEACHLLKSEYPEGTSLNAHDVERVIKKNRFDPFILGSQLGSRNFQEFYATLVNRDYSFDEMRQAFLFLQSHVVKLLDSSYVKRKSRPSQYDRQIVAHGKKWQTAELVELLQQLARFELASKEKDSSLKNQLRLHYLRS